MRIWFWVLGLRRQNMADFYLTGAPKISQIYYKMIHFTRLPATYFTFQLHRVKKMRFYNKTFQVSFLWDKVNEYKHALWKLEKNISQILPHTHTKVQALHVEVSLVITLNQIDYINNSLCFLRNLFFALFTQIKKNSNDNVTKN